MEELVVALLKLLVQVVLYAFTGKWHHFSEADDQAAPAAQPDQPDQPGSKRSFVRTRAEAAGASPRGANGAAARAATARALPDLRDPRAAREALRRALEARLRGAPAEADASWFTFPDEYVEDEPEDEAVGGELASRPTFQQQKPKQEQVPVVPQRGRPRSFASAVRDRQTQRYAVVLGAALGPRGTRR